MADWSAATAYAASYGVLCAGSVEPLLDLLGAPAGTLLDVGAGPGTLAAAARIRGWEVVAVEPDPAMRSLAAAALPDGVVLPGALPDLPFPAATFDAVGANLVVNHLSDPRAGVRDLVRVARPGGPVGVTIWPAAENAMTPFWGRVIDEAGARRPPGLRLDPSLDFPRSASGLAGLLVDAELTGVRTAISAFEFAVRREALWAAVESGIGVAGRTYRAQEDGFRSAMRSAFDRSAAAAVHDVLRFPAQALLAVGRRPLSAQEASSTAP